MSSIKLPGVLLGIEIGFQLGKMFRDLWREVKKERMEKNKPTVCLDCPLAKAIERKTESPVKTRKLEIIK